MAEVLGVVASGAQLLQLVASLSREVYNFLAALKDAPADVALVTNGLEALDAVLQNIRPGHVGRPCLAESLNGLKAQLEALRRLLPVGSQGLKPLQRLKWVFDEKKINRIGTKIAEYKSSLQMAMMVISLDEGIKQQQKSEEIHQLAQASHSIALKNFAELGKGMAAVHAGLLPLLANTRLQLADRSDSMLTTANSLMLEYSYPSKLSQSQHGKMVLKQSAARVVNDTDAESMSSYQSTPAQSNQVTFKETLQAVDLRSTHAQIDSRALYLESNSGQCSEKQDQLALRNSQQDMAEGSKNLKKVIDMFIEPGETNISRIVRSTLQTVLFRVLDGCVGQYTSWYDGALAELKSMIDEISNMISQGEQGGWDCGPFKRTDSAQKQRPQVLCEEWHSKRSIGSLTVRITTTRPARKSRMNRGRMFEVSCGFLPDPKVFRGHGVAAMISPQTNRGFSQICPMVVEFAVQPSDSPVFEYSGTGGFENLYQLQNLFQGGLASPNIRDEDGWTPLHHAASKGHFEVCQLLLNENADPCAENKYGTNALDALLRWSFTRLASERQRQFFPGKSSSAVLQEFKKTCMLLEEAGADPEESFEESGKFILSQLTSDTIYTTKGFQEEMVLPEWSAFLKNRGFDVNGQDEMGRTALMEKACRSHYADSGSGLATILRLGADVSVADKAGRQALHWAVSQFKYTPIEWGFESEADARDDRVRKVAELIKFGANVYARDSEGCSVTRTADENGVSDIWDEGLKRCRLDPEEVRREDFRRSYMARADSDLVSATDALHINIKTAGAAAVQAVSVEVV